MSDRWAPLRADAAAAHLELQVHRGSDDAPDTAALKSLVGISHGDTLVEVRTSLLAAELREDVLVAAIGAALAHLRDEEHERDVLARRIYEASGGYAPWDQIDDRVKASARRCADVAIAAGADPRRLP